MPTYGRATPRLRSAPTITILIDGKTILIVAEQTPETSFLLTADDTRGAIEVAGFRARVWRDDTGAAKNFFEEIAQAGPPPGPTLGVLIGPEFRTVTGNLARSIMEGRVAVAAGVFEAV